MNGSEVTQLFRAADAVRSGQARALRRAAGLSQADVAAAVGGSPAAICRWENGSRQPFGSAGRRYLRFVASLVRAAEAARRVDREREAAA